MSKVLFIYHFIIFIRTGIRCVRWTAEGKYIAICGEDGNIMVASVTSGDIKACFTIDKDCHVSINRN